MEITTIFDILVRLAYILPKNIYVQVRSRFVPQCGFGIYKRYIFVYIKQD